ncbi:fdxN element excision controlling factor protein [Cylindrospermum sp. NIES-4074]|nr:fdxN element excision controlling factor protein [Cylindrospermum sp. NIES-4074]
MDTLDNYRQIIQKILTEYSQLPYAYGELERQLIIDKTANHYLLLTPLHLIILIIFLILPLRLCAFA